MLFTLTKPKSNRFFQLNFEGFTPHGKNKIEKFIRTLLSFLKVLQRYLLRRVFFVLVIPGRVLVFLHSIAGNTKTFTTQKLIWSRGRLGRPVATFLVLNVAFGVFILGKVLNSSKYVNAQELDPDYLTNVIDIIPQRNSAITVLPEDRQRSEPLAYIVEGGDTLSGIGNKFKVSADALKYVNSLTDNSILSVGQTLTIPPVSGLIHKVEKGDTLRSIGLKYDVPSQAIADFNYIIDTSKLKIGAELVVPGAKVPTPVYIPAVPSNSNFVLAPNVDPNASKGWCMWPTPARIITQYFSWYHNGLDIAVGSPVMPPLYACSGGTVTRAGWDPWGLGLHVRIQHSNGYMTMYGHMSRLDVGVGDEVKKGQVIGLMGSTGRSTGPHVHFIVSYKGVPRNPLDYIK